MDGEAREKDLSVESQVEERSKNYNGRAYHEDEAFRLSVSSALHTVGLQRARVICMTLILCILFPNGGDMAQAINVQALFKWRGLLTRYRYNVSSNEHRGRRYDLSQAPILHMRQIIAVN